MGCTREEYHAGLCCVNSPVVKRSALMPRRIASNSMSTPPLSKEIKISNTTTPLELCDMFDYWIGDMFDHSIGDVMITIQELDQLINML
tara:strand:+ start:4009 stop:4275 length:267 start_codon:yes stop_codon:yes gene_type:complete